MMNNFIKLLIGFVFTIVLIGIIISSLGKSDNKTGFNPANFPDVCQAAESFMIRNWPVFETFDKEFTKLISEFAIDTSCNSQAKTKSDLYFFMRIYLKMN